MGDLREHELPKRYRVCCLSCCEHDTKEVGAEKMHYCKEKDDDDDNNCASLKKHVKNDDLQCECQIFKLLKKDPQGRREKWRLVPKETRTQKDDDDYYFDCFCVVDADKKAD
jgi:hypothetical protein